MRSGCSVNEFQQEAQWRLEPPSVSHWRPSLSFTPKPQTVRLWGQQLEGSGSAWGCSVENKPLKGRSDLETIRAPRSLTQQQQWKTLLTSHELSANVANKNNEWYMMHCYILIIVYALQIWYYFPCATHCTTHKNLPKSKMKYLLQHLWLNTFETPRHSPHTSTECICDKARGRQFSSSSGARADKGRGIMDITISMPQQIWN